ncbi:hypothetical protein F511_43045 [Dorcoceras hygrometricum]|uniref:Uncharacterized protein n=1 Tax=Dorcoceras hygrometricum TaxID=472368 RepID=A0A2Z7AMS1_9LAMI|nr:hypothetical protein F511_43045 [Dorcoceras hygrometricum]
MGWTAALMCDERIAPQQVIGASHPFPIAQLLEIKKKPSPKTQSTDWWYLRAPSDSYYGNAHKLPSISPSEQPQVAARVNV